MKKSLVFAASLLVFALISAPLTYAQTGSGSSTGGTMQSGQSGTSTQSGGSMQSGTGSGSMSGGSGSGTMSEPPDAIR